MNIDLEAKARIEELESLLEDRMIVIDLRDEEIAELEADNKALRGQIKQLLQNAGNYPAQEVA